MVLTSRLQPTTFDGTGKPLESEQWIVDVTSLLSAARVPDEDQVDMVKIQPTDVARIWWLAEENKLQKPITWKFTDSFLERFFHLSAKREMESQFCNLKQWNMSADAYAAKFIRLSRFAPHMVANEANRANRFQKGLTWDLQEKLAFNHFDTYDQVLTTACRIKTVSVRRNRGKMQSKPGKRPFPQPSKGN